MIWDGFKESRCLTFEYAKCLFVAQIFSQCVELFRRILKTVDLFFSGYEEGITDEMQHDFVLLVAVLGSRLDPNDEQTD